MLSVSASGGGGLQRHNSRPAGCELLASSASKASDPDDEDGLFDICQRIRIRMA